MSRTLDFNDSQTSATEPSVVFTPCGQFAVYANDTEYVTAKGTSAEEGDNYWNSTEQKLRIRNASAWIYGESEQSNISAITAAGTSDDSSEGYEPLSFWINSATSEIQVCIDASESAAVWPRIATDGDVATINASISSVESDLEIHAGATSAHGISGAVVGTTDTQTLTNKTLGGASIATPTRLDAKQGTLSDLETYALTASDGQLCFATDSKKTYCIIDGALSEVGSGGAGDSDTIALFRADGLTAATDLDITGNNTSFDGGGSITADSLSLSSTASDLILDGKVIKYAPGADGSNDYFGFTQAIPQGLRGRSIGFTFEYKTDSTTEDDDFRFCVKIKDGVSAGYTYYDNLEAYYTANNEAVRFSEGYFIPADCTEVEFGWQNTDTTTTVVLMVDNILISSNPFVYKDLTDVQYIKYDGHAGYGSTNNKIPYFTTQVSNVGAQLVTIENSSVNGFSITALRKCRVNIVFSPNSNNGSEATWGISLNSSSLTTSILSLADSEVMAATYTASSTGRRGVVTASVELNAGDVLRPHTTGLNPYGTISSIHATVEAQSEHVVTPAKSAIEEVYYDGYASKDGSGNIKFKTAQRNTLSKLASVDNTTYTKFTALKKVFVIAKTTGQSASVASVNLRHYNNQNIQLSVSKYVTAATYTQTATLPILMNPGDYLLVNTNAAMGDQVATNFSAVFVDFEQQILSAIPTQQTCYIKDVKAYNATGGNTSAGTYYVRDLNVINETGSNTSSLCSFATLNGSNQFTLQAGTYDFSAEVPFFSCNTAVAFLRDTSAGTNDVYGGISAQSYQTTTTGASGLIPLAGRLTLSSAKTFEVKMYAESTRTAGLGQPAGVSGISSVYTQVEITKIK